MIGEYCENPKFRYICIAGPFREWDHAENFRDGYVHARQEADIKAPGKVMRALVRDMQYNGELIGFKGNNVRYIPEGFYVVRKVELKQEEIAKIKQDRLKSKADKAMEEAEQAIKYAKKLRKEAGIS